MDPQELRDDQWAIIEAFVPGGRKGRRGPRSDGRKFINALLWLARSGARWRDIPERYGKYQTIKRRYYRWLDEGIIDAIFQSLFQEADMEWIQIDSTIIKAHKHAAGAPLKKRGQASQCLGRSRGGFTTKLHAVSEGLGLPLRFEAGAGQEHDMKQAVPLVNACLPAGHVLADKAYDADALINLICEAGAKACIPPKSNRLAQRTYDKALYKERNQVERMFGKLKEFRRVATRYDKLVQTFMGFVKLAAIYLWLK